MFMRTYMYKCMYYILLKSRCQRLACLLPSLPGWFTKPNNNLTVWFAMFHSVELRLSSAGFLLAYDDHLLCVVCLHGWALVALAHLCDCKMWLCVASEQRNWLPTTFLLFQSINSIIFIYMNISDVCRYIFFCHHHHYHGAAGVSLR